MNKLQIKVVSSLKEMKEFIYLPEKLHRDHPNWVPPIYREEWNYLNPKKNLAYAYCDTVIALAETNGKTSGRIMGIINKRFNSEKNEKTARFAYFESINDQELAGSLLRFVEDWAHDKGMNKLIGPFGMYYHDPIGYMTWGFNSAPSFSANYNHPYIVDLLQNAGYEKEEDLVVYKVPIPEKFPDSYNRIQQRVLGNPRLSLLKFKSRSEIRRYIYPVLNLMNESYVNIFGYSRLDEKEMDEIAGHYIPLLDPKYVTVVTYDDKVAGFMIALPSLNKGIIAAKGKIFPLGFLKILYAARKAKQLDLLIGGIDEKVRGMGIDALIAIHIIEMAKKGGFTAIDSHLELESNWKIRAEMEKMGGEITKKYRIFKKELT